MAVVAAETRVFLEVRRRLQSALLILGEPDEGGGMQLDFTVTPTSLLLRTPDRCTEIRLPAGVRLVPSSCRGLQYVGGDGLHLRLQAQAESSPQLIPVFNRSLQAQARCTFYCQSCGDITIKDRKLLRVLPLPSENWAALVGEWCCHPDPFANKPLHPRENDCFLGDSFFLVNLRSDVEQEPKANTKVICKRCKVILGETISSAEAGYITENGLAILILRHPPPEHWEFRLASSWESDISVHPLTLPSATCLELLLILSRNNASLPLSLRQMNSFQVAFLKI
ncbi:E3 ubiquitin-protein ligase E3D [Psammomys obesus]|uniref:E3 ubiquitin-protein ligase E3D n=1 Tax=Psammomys obesus TaxID=48139 RepID=UPI0024534A2A|nr:E3 ubiquitin-protein ligase E3D [Psammomys obesus]